MGVQQQPNKPPTVSMMAREALRRLAAQRLPPTPDNYSRVYHEVGSAEGGPTAPDPGTILHEVAGSLPTHGAAASADVIALKRAVEASDWAGVKPLLLRLCAPETAAAQDGAAWPALFRDFLRNWDIRTTGITQARKRESLDHVLNAFGASEKSLYPRLRGLVRSWADAATAPPVLPGVLVASDHVAVPGANVASSAHVVNAAHTASAHEVAATLPTAVETREAVEALLRDLLAQTLTFAVVERLGNSPELAREAIALAAEARAAHTNAAISAFAERLKRFWIELEIRSDDVREVQSGLLRLLYLVTGNITELVPDDSWLHGQLKSLEALTTGPIDRNGIALLETTLREIVYKQGSLKRGLDQAKDALKQMLATFIDRLGTMVESTGGYHDRIGGYAERIEQANDISEISEIIAQVLQDTRGVQTNLHATREELLSARREVDQYQDRIHSLEQELLALSSRAHEDALTSLLNRRGLERGFAVEAARADRQNESMCVAILDIDNFKGLNDQLGHQGGDQALVHLAGVVRQAIRPTDLIARFGGDEFVILLPQTEVDDALQTMVRVQRELTRHFFLHNNEKVLITFSAGVAMRASGESQEEVTARADGALYRAKQLGKNQVAKA